MINKKSSFIPRIYENSSCEEHTTFSTFNITRLTPLTGNAVITIFTNLTTYGNIIKVHVTIGK